MVCRAEHLWLGLTLRDLSWRCLLLAPSFEWGSASWRPCWLPPGNQAIFEKIWLGHEDVENAELKQPFDAIRVLSEATRVVDLAAARQEIEAGRRPRTGKLPSSTRNRELWPLVRLVHLWWS